MRVPGRAPRAEAGPEARSGPLAPGSETPPAGPTQAAVGGRVPPALAVKQ
jgi:hypothetical protein